MITTQIFEFVGILGLRNPISYHKHNSTQKMKQTDLEERGMFADLIPK